MRDVMVDAVKSLETEQIRDQKRIRFVDDIYDASMAEDGDFLSPLRRKNDPEMDRLVHHILQDHYHKILPRRNRLFKLYSM